MVSHGHPAMIGLRHTGRTATKDKLDVNATESGTVRNNGYFKWTTFTNMRILLSCQGINLKTRLRVLKCYVWPTLFYGAETWSITKSLLSRLDAFEMWIYRRVLKILWTEKRRMGTGREIVRQFKTRKLQYLGHFIIRHNTSQLLEGNIEGRRSRGRPRTTWITDLTNSTGAKYYQQKIAAEDRKR